MAPGICGSRFYVGEKGDPRREGTIGGILFINGIHYGLAVLRPFLIDPDQNDVYREPKTPVVDERSEEALFAPISSVSSHQSYHISCPDLYSFFAIEAYEYHTGQRIGVIPQVPGSFAPNPRYWHCDGNWVLVQLDRQAVHLENTTRLHYISSGIIPEGRLRVTLHHHLLRTETRKLKAIDVQPVGRMYALSSSGRKADSGAWIIDTGNMSVYAVMFGCDGKKTYARPAFAVFAEIINRFKEEPPLITMRLSESLIGYRKTWHKETCDLISATIYRVSQLGPVWGGLRCLYRLNLSSIMVIAIFSFGN
ncbi:uncharacterized protein BO97DRAFT_414717 [Aspergillus homomorphus CBS 101889]|uniref:Uncharacterized protein n=1 Tax=Aspergillus homomorphus (strain CBS 101889) TaxID=1450537 RepID=A0A395HWH0_ASPHC|nr:hypothetical protein BO97DRAFT_414717 [Aspergillus homomorphus CBS 101889]RAL11775.1 hypothetical protein BO97DRAFT_414717 [Aspergillus homomorphus CBS 101889]